MLLRTAYSSTIARPGFNQANATLLIDTGSNAVACGNPDLQPLTANSFDISIEKYLADAGIISFGLFDKELSNYIVANVKRGQTWAGYPGLFAVASYANAPKSYARGFELNYEQRFKELPGISGGLGASLNWTHVDSRFEIRPG